MSCLPCLSQTQVGGIDAEGKSYNPKSVTMFTIFCIFFQIEVQIFFSHPGMLNRLRKKNEAKSTLPNLSEAVKENDTPQRMPPPAAVKSK